MRILLTGSSGWLGHNLITRLIRAGHKVVGVNPVPSPNTQILGSIVDRELVRGAIHDCELDAIVHAAGLHKPNIRIHQAEDFIAVNVQGALNLLEEAVATGSRIDRFVFTSTTLLMISREIRAGHAAGTKKAVWISHGATRRP
jgi:UDP-glucose 4-epimerase